ncbi:MAG: hypothetical protein R3B70_31415 [Polyangiaceae bacterium]
MISEVYSSLAAATSGNNNIRTRRSSRSPRTSATRYAGSGYPQSAQNLSMLSLATDAGLSPTVQACRSRRWAAASRGLTSSLEIGVND